MLAEKKITTKQGNPNPGVWWKVVIGHTVTLFGNEINYL